MILSLIFPARFPVFAKSAVISGAPQRRSWTNAWGARPRSRSSAPTSRPSASATTRARASAISGPTATATIARCSPTWAASRSSAPAWLTSIGTLLSDPCKKKGFGKWIFSDLATVMWCCWENKRFVPVKILNLLNPRSFLDNRSVLSRLTTAGLIRPNLSE